MSEYLFSFGAEEYNIVDNVATGYAVKWNSQSNLTWSDKLGKAIYAQFSPTAFNDSLETRKNKITANVQHDRKQVLGKYPKTLSLSVDYIGLKYSLKLPDTQLGKDTKTLIADGTYAGLSVGVAVGDINKDITLTKNKDGTWNMVYNKAILQEVSIVDMPCFNDSCVELQKAIYAIQEKYNFVEQRNNELRNWHLSKIRSYEYDQG